MLTLDIAVVTHGPEGILRVEKMLLNPIDNVRYVVSWQNHNNAPIPDKIVERKDVEVHRLGIPGISNNRNNALEHSKGDIVLFSDDDLIYNKDSLLKIIEIFEKDNSLDVGLFKVDFFNKKNYPAEELKLSLPLPKNYYVSSVEIALRRDRINDLRFYPELGLGAEKMLCGEEELFLYSCLKRGMKCRFFPVEICSHPDPTTGDMISPGVLMAMGFVSTILYPVSSFLRRPLKALRLSKTKKVGLFKALISLSKGAIKAKTGVNKIPKCYRW